MLMRKLRHRKETEKKTEREKEKQRKKFREKKERERKKGREMEEIEEDSEVKESDKTIVRREYTDIFKKKTIHTRKYYRCSTITCNPMTSVALLLFSVHSKVKSLFKFENQTRTVNFTYIIYMKWESNSIGLCIFR